MILTFSQLTVYATDFSVIAKNPKIVQALQALERVNKREVLLILFGHNTTKKPIRVMFRELEVYGLTNCEAVTMRTKNGGLVILIHKKHETAPAETIASLIAHESQHHTMTGTKSEEIRAWIYEISTWNTFVRENREIASSDSELTKRLNYISNLYKFDGEKKIVNIIAKNPVYADLN